MVRNSNENMKKNPVETANLISRLFFWWTLKLFRKGNRGGLNMHDLYAPAACDKSESVTNKLETSWNYEIEKSMSEGKTKIYNGCKMKLSKPNFINAILRTFWLENLYIGLLLLFQTVILRSIQPICQARIISFFNSRNLQHPTTQNEALSYAGAFITTTLGITFIMHHMNVKSQQLGMKIRVSCSSLIYRKSLRLSESSLESTAGGQIINLLSNDVNRFDLLPMYFNYLWVMPIQIIIVGYLMWQSIEIYILVGFVTMFLLCIPMQGYVLLLSGKLRKLIAKLTDRRIQLISEIIAGIQVIKMYAWEKAFNKMISETRLAEVKKIHSSLNVRGLYNAFIVFTERTALFVTLVTFVLMGNSIKAEITFQLSSYFYILEVVVVIYVPQALISCSEAVISAKRIEEFLLLEEITKTQQDLTKIIKSTDIIDLARLSPVKTPNAVRIELYKVSANWIVGQLPPTLCEITLNIKGGDLCALVGPVGSGKSSLLNLLLQELPIGAGKVGLYQFKNENSNDCKSKHGFIQDNPEMTVSYASQSPWLFSGTVRENILFGLDYNDKRYQEVTRVCSLLRDFKQLPDGDLTTVGERGASLSGGQRARVNLARAIYKQADLYLLDDPLSAVDARIGRRIFKECILEYLRGKTRILVTHQLSCLKQADTIGMIKRGHIKYQGNFDTLTKTSLEFNNLLNARKKNDNESSDNTTDELDINNLIKDKNSFLRFEKSRTSQVSVKSQDSYQIMPYQEFTIEEAESNARAKSESMESGRLSNKVYYKYFHEGGNIYTIILLIIVHILSQIATSGVDYWLGYWTNLETIRTSCVNFKDNCSVYANEYKSIVNNTFFQSLSILDDDGFLPITYAIYIYATWIIGCIVLTILRCYVFINICIHAGHKLHNDMFSNVLQATMYFFHTNPSGRILNRFSKDVGAMDELLPRAMLEALQILFLMMGIFVIILSINPWMGVPTVIIGVLFYFIRIYYLKTAQDIRRMEGIAKSPVFSHVSTTLNGLTTIRSRGKDVQSMLCKEFDQYQDIHTGAWFLVITTGSAFGLILDLIACIFVTCVCFSLILMDPENTSSGSVGLSISQALILTSMVQYGVRQTTVVELQMTSVERIIQYFDLPKEGTMELSKPPPVNWPWNGQIEWKNVSMSYKNNDPPVLKNIELTIKSVSKVGVVGRTGAGKTSLIAALFRLVDDGLNGKIIMDGLDTRSISLQDLRTSISIVPQEPVLFSETLRYNLDPFGKYTDTAMWDALREVELNDVTLDQWVTESGSNFSVGQRQLICLARALLRNNKILVLDEVTANIDSQTDALIQRAIRKKFSDCTVITIAHRLSTIIDSDKILVMENGHAAEFGSPYELLFERPNSLFAKMVNQTGDVMAKKLSEEIVKYHYQQIDSANNDINQQKFNIDSHTIVEN
ncbi:ATP-binding cassette sub-family C member 4-like [Microplitis mediator]|uniref:ATP-binding cassette sub-family C member 4-like n=1 Tax=Microplitis mediator TaxID=375433 RepID=UPI00255217D4|nr:ATP-binding cassette sub-family C member 4-like [Microplitis mediator]XP_057321789.1 ATP-binding cassette sub-family C member 4-like [Microplitis mediator]XP_057321790.1 ATP-binding cassette sub-family C member 4-like [Microplitis mediator]XP_057321791.1 ATP-binding cassette sub-family C member 4-like [Microplitis mediator]XP_057321792.1 ATP-binding cassette sub-family C member 4-like [Microplitis mediator]